MFKHKKVLFLNIKTVVFKSWFLLVFKLFKVCFGCVRFKKLDGVGPIDNRPSTDKLHHLVKKKIYIGTCETQHVTRDM